MTLVLERIIVAYDDPASDTLERAADLAHALDAEVIVTNVVVPGESGEVDGSRYAEERLSRARSYLETRRVRADFVVSRGSPADAIVALAKERNADLIVVGTRKKKFFERLVEGSVNQEVLRRAPCDVLVVF